MVTGEPRLTHRTKPPRAGRVRKSDGKLPLFVRKTRKGKHYRERKFPTLANERHESSKFHSRSCEPATESKQKNSRVRHLD